MSITKTAASIPSFVYYILLLLIFGIFAFSKTFHLAIFGDEWQVLYIIKNSILTGEQWNSYLNQAIGPGYHMAALIMYLLVELFGFNGKAVYMFSFITRFFAALTLFYFLRKRGCSNKAAFLGSLFFLVTPIGLQATDWVKNFTSYISIIFFLLCLNSIYTLKSWRNILFFLLTFSMSMFINPIRAPGIILTTIFLLIYQYLFNGLVNKKSAFFSLFCSITIAFIFLKMFAPGNFNIGQLSIETFFGAIGAAILPQPSFYYLSLLIATLLLWKSYLLSKKYLLFTLPLIAVTLPIFFGPFLKISNDKMMAILGIYLTLFMISTFIIELFNKKISEALNTSLPFLLIICFLIAPLLVGTLVIDPTHRYLIYSALSLPIIVAFSLQKKPFSLFKPSSIRFWITLLLLVMFYLSLKSEINEIYLRHNQDTAKIIWQQITPYFDNYDFKNRSAVVFFDTNNGAIVHDAVTFGFGFRMGYIYKIWSQDVNDMWKLPTAVDSLADFNSMITDGKVTKKYFGAAAKDFVFPKEDAFYFKIDGVKVSRIKDY